MGDTQYHQQQQSSSRLGLRNTVGEIVQVQGGHIVRSIGRKDRHSKVCTAKGPRDRRVRLAAHTAIQFYDVQDRLGFDRPSKAVDWLMKNAKPAIDELEELPAWNPTTGLTGNANFEQSQRQQAENPQYHHQQQVRIDVVDNTIDGPSSKRAMSCLLGITNNNQSFMPPSMDSEANSSVMPFRSFVRPDILSRSSSQSQDLRLSLQSFQDPILLHHHNQQTQHQHAINHDGEQGFCSPLGFDTTGWSHNQSEEMSRFQRMAAWNAGGYTGTSGGGDEGTGFLFNSQPLFGQTQFFSERGPLQSSNTPYVRAWMEPSAIAMATTSDHHQTLPIHLPSSLSGSGIGFASGGGFSGFRIPSRIQGEEEEHDGISHKPSSVSSDSRH